MADIDMSVVQEALQRRRAGGGSSLLSQVSGAGVNPMSGAPAQQGVPTPPTTMPGTAPATAPATARPQMQNPQSQAKKPKPQPAFDDDTKAAAKVLMSKLMDVL